MTSYLPVRTLCDVGPTRIVTADELGGVVGEGKHHLTSLQFLRGAGVLERLLVCVGQNGYHMDMFVKFNGTAVCVVTLLSNMDYEEGDYEEEEEDD